MVIEGLSEANNQRILLSYSEKFFEKYNKPHPHKEIRDLLFFYPLGEKASFFLKEELRAEWKYASQRDIIEPSKSGKSNYKDSLFLAGLEEIMYVSLVHQYLSEEGSFETDSRFSKIFSDYLMRTTGPQELALRTPEGSLRYYDYLMNAFHPSPRQLASVWRNFHL